LRYNPNLKETDVVEAAASLIDMGINIIVPTLEVIKSSINITFSHSITIYDAFYVAIAKEIDFTLITADNKLSKKTKKPQSSQRTQRLRYCNPCLWDVFYSRIYTDPYRFFVDIVCRSAPSVTYPPSCAIHLLKYNYKNPAHNKYPTQPQ